MPGLITFFINHEIQILRLKAGLTIDEIGLLAEGLGKARSDLKPQKDLASWLVAQHIQHATVEQAQFLTVRQDADMAKKLQAFFDQNAEKPEALLEYIEKAFARCQAETNRDSREAMWTETIAELAQLPADMIRKLYEDSLPETIDVAALRTDLSKALPPELRTLLESEGLLGRPSPAPAAPHPGVEDIEQIVSSPAQALEKPSTPERLRQLLEELCMIGSDERLLGLTRKMIENLQRTEPKIRSACAKLLQIFYDTFATHQKNSLGAIVQTGLEAVALQEMNATVYIDIAADLARIAVDHLTHGRFPETKKALRVLREHVLQEELSFPERQALARKAIEQFLQHGLDTLCADLTCPIKERELGAEEILGYLGEEAAIPLTLAIRRSHDPRVRQSASESLRRLGPSVQAKALQSLDPGLPADELLRLFPCLQSAGHAAVFSSAPALLKHPDGAVRREMVRYLSETKDNRAEEILLSLFDDPDTSVQVEVVRALREAGAKKVGSQLIGRLAGTSGPVLEELCLVLGEWRIPGAIAAFEQVLAGKHRFWQKPSDLPEPLTLKILWAASRFLPNEDAKRLLQRKSKDPRPAVRRAVAAALAQ